MQGFRLTKEMVDAGFSGGSIKATDAGHLFNIGEALMEQNPETGEFAINPYKIIVTDDDVFAEVLASHPALERLAAEAVPGDVEPVESPLKLMHLAGADTGPYTPQTNDVPPGGPVNPLAVAPLGDAGADLQSSVTVEHADEPASVEQALEAGEQVSGSYPQSATQEEELATS